jgi:adenine-specific DNA-methyltransferase
VTSSAARDHARSLRVASTDAERLLWRRLRGRQLGGFKFRRQHPVGGYIADFACLEARLCVELDGSQHLHGDQLDADRKRTSAMNASGFEVLRFDNRQMLLETAAVLEVILKALQDRASGAPRALTPTLSRKRERESSHD